MKKVVAFILSVLIMTGCGRSAGVTGGGDAPAAMTAGEEAQVQGVKMLRAEGALYYDTGTVSSLVPRCGTLAGSLEREYDEFEIPLYDGESNFEAKGYQNATGITKEVPLEGDWRIFKRLPGSETDFDRYKYVLRLKGRHPNAVKDSELIVLTNDMTVNFDMVSRSMFSSLSTDFLDCYIVPVPDEDKWGILLWADNVTDKGLTIVCEQLGGNAAGDLMTGEWYSLEVMNEDNQWEEVECLPRDYEVVWHSVAYGINKNDITEFEVDWEWLYGELPGGYYRIAKEIMDFRGTGDFEKDIYYAGFYIE